MIKIRALIRLLFLLAEIIPCAIRIIFFEGYQIEQFNYSCKKLKYPKKEIDKNKFAELMGRIAK